MSSERGPLREISWRDICPWLILFRSFRISIGLHVVLLAALGVTACTGGWMISELLFVSNETLEEDRSFQRLVEGNSQWPWEVGQQVASFGRGAEEAGNGVVGRFLDRAAAIPQLFINKFVKPFHDLFEIDVTLVKSAYCLFGGLWCLAVWSFFGAAITRIAVMRLGCEERVGLKESLRHACRKFGAYFAAPLMPLIAVTVLVLPLIAVGLLMKSDMGMVVAGFLWLFVILDALVIGVLLIGLVFGWPLMWGTVSAEGTDSFDALSRSYNYTFQRPLHFLFYAVAASLFGVFCFYLVGLFTNMVSELALWGTSWGSGNDRIREVQNAANYEGDMQAEGAPAGTLRFGVDVILFFTGFIYLLAGAFVYSFFWSMVSAIYLLLRFDVDQTEFDEIWLEEDEKKYELPQLKSGQSSVPQLDSTDRDSPNASDDESESKGSPDDKQAKTEADSTVAPEQEGADPEAADPNTNGADADNVKAEKEGDSSDDVDESASDDEKEPRDG